MGPAERTGMFDAVQRRSTDYYSFVDQEPIGSGAAPAATPRSIPNAPTTSDHAAFYTSLHTNATSTVNAASPSRDDVVGKKLDDLKARYSGPYNVGSQTVSAPAMFAMNGGISSKNATKHGAEVRALLPGTATEAALKGMATPEQLVQVTQALIDAGKLPSGPGDLATRIKAMQWHYGVGVDCACYTRQALQAVTGKAEHVGLKPLGTEGFRGLDTNANFAKVKPDVARPGDIMTLDDPDGATGHNVIVRSHTMMDEAANQALITKWGPDAKAFLNGPGPFHTIEVDSSWGAGEGSPLGGVRRDTWIYDEGSKQWGSVNLHANPPEFIVGKGPAGEKFHGTYRMKGEG
jgi:hypothetical protein